MKKFKVAPPIGFSFKSGKEEDILSENQVIDLVISMNPTLIKKNTH
jgi:hypothetical protein